MASLVTPTKISGLCEKELQKYCAKGPKGDDKQVYLIPDPVRPDRFYLQGGVTDIAIGSHGQRVGVVLMEDNIWIHFSITFRRVKSGSLKTHELEGVTMQFFQGLYDAKTLLFRAEWDNGEVNEYHHPQPHWHIHPETKYLISGQEYDPDTFKEYLDLVEGDKGFAGQVTGNVSVLSKKPELPSFHFAMASRWDNLSTDRARTELTEDNLVKWIPGCLESVKLQLKYMLN